jgi:putative DNA primase/helicase
MMNISHRTVLPASKQMPFWIGTIDKKEGLDYRCFKNGILNIKQIKETLEPPQTLEPFSSNYINTIQLQFEYDVNAQCPEFIKFMDSILTKEQQEIMMVVFALAILDQRLGMMLEYFFFLLGEGQNGKGVVMACLRMLVGEENVSSVPLRKFDDSNMLSSMAGKLVNIAGDMGQIKDTDEDNLLMITGEDPIQVREVYKPALTWIPNIILIFACNDLPHLRNIRAIKRRFFPINFSANISDEEKDIFLKQKLHSELPGIFNLVVQAYIRLLKNNCKFEIPADGKKIAENHLKEGDSVAMWAEEYLEESDTPPRKPTTFYMESYAEYCRKCNIKKPVASVEFGKRLRRIFPKLERIGGCGRPYMYKGIRLRDMTDDPNSQLMPIPIETKITRKKNMIIDPVADAYATSKQIFGN